MTRYQLEHTKGINEVFKFGKYKGQTILQVLDKNAGYIVWCIQNVKGFQIDENLKQEILRQHSKWQYQRENAQCNAQIKALMEKPNYMHATEAMDFIEYELDSLTPNH